AVADGQDGESRQRDRDDQHLHAVKVCAVERRMDRKLSVIGRSNSQKARRSSQISSEREVDRLLDDVGWRLLMELQEDGRVPFAELGRRVGLSAPAVVARVGRPEGAGGTSA